MFTQRKLHKIALLTVMGLGLLPASATAYTINFLGADAGNTMAAVPSNNNFVQSGNGLRANGTTWGPPTQTLGGGPWSGFQTNRSVTVENLLNVYSGYSLPTPTSLSAQAGKSIPALSTPSICTTSSTTGIFAVDYHLNHGVM